MDRFETTDLSDDDKMIELPDDVEKKEKRRRFWFAKPNKPNKPNTVDTTCKLKVYTDRTQNFFSIDGFACLLLKTVLFTFVYF